ncbi:hypothetical protein H3246_23205, partial [Escherichia coli]|nr:hypothetical protein [Escherichia coli]
SRFSAIKKASFLTPFIGVITISTNTVQLLGSGSILRHVREAAEILAKDYGVGSDVYSVTSFTELARE